MHAFIQYKSNKHAHTHTVIYTYKHFVAFKNEEYDKFRKKLASVLESKNNKHA